MALDKKKKLKTLKFPSDGTEITTLQPYPLFLFDNGKTKIVQIYINFSTVNFYKKNIYQLKLDFRATVYDENVSTRVY